MASGERSLDHHLSGELTCPVCLEIFQDPRKLPCEHDLCRQCAENLLRTGDGNGFNCPECRETVNVGDQGIDALRRNVRLKNIIDSLKRKNSDKGIRPRAQRVAIRSVRQKDENAELLSDICDEQKDTCKKAKDLLDAECESLISIIRERQRIMTCTVHSEKEQRIDILEKKLAELQSKADHGIAVTIYSQETITTTDPASFLRQYKDVKESISAATNDINVSLGEWETRCIPRDLQYEFNFNLVKTSLKNLNFCRRGIHDNQHSTDSVAKNGSQTGQQTRSGGYSKISFSLDPDTAHRDLKLTNKNLTVKWDALGARNRRVSNCDRRFVGAINPCVLADREIYGGICYWEATVKDCVQYRVGVISNSNINRKEQLGSNKFSWCLRNNYGSFKALHDGLEESIRVFDDPMSIGVYLDLNNKVLAFYDPPRKFLLHKWSDVPFGPGPITPAFYICKDGTLTIKTDLSVPFFCRDE
ncbi:E3 ubiquitin-protein ligase Midline-1-like isoform X2 [Ptychodera flava]|uniref:E3 ubiquitin-protein ligase Midline-1-like isoform X2 n=1 Tax=Ptychodera flava TaxID=63121 RepID=UPI00396A328E